MATVIPTNLSTIMQAVEQQLLAYTSPVVTAALVNVPGNNGTIAGNISNIYWVNRGEEPPPGQTGQRDILLAKLDERPTNVQGAARFTEMKSGIAVYLRSTLVSDKRSTIKDWLITHELLVNAVMDALMDFFPVDGSGNALTIEGFVMSDNVEPKKPIKDTKTWGQTVGTYRFHYLPGITIETLDPTV